jgi:2-hydroxychromene-2-carboxylate isomerase
VPKPVDFFYGLGSRYSYLASTQIAQLEADTGCLVRWRPLFSADLFAARGADPFRGEPISGQYDWSYRRFDAACWADYYGVPFREPDEVKADWRLLALAATAADRLGAVEPFSRRVFEAAFVRDSSPLDATACLRLAAEVGLDRSTFAAALEAPETTAALTATLADAQALGVFGVPSFVVEGQVYWGNDRLPIVRHMLLRRGAPLPRPPSKSAAGASAAGRRTRLRAGRPPHGSRRSRLRA